MKRIVLILILGLALLLSACTGGKDNTEKPSAGGSDSKFAQTSNADSQKEESTSQASQPDESSKPEESSSKPQESSSKPEESSSKPQETSSKPQESSSKPQESSSKPEESSDDGTPDFLKDATDSQKAAFYAASERYSNNFYSYQGLIDALYYQEDFDYDDAEWAVDHLDANWYGDALGYANYQLDNSGYSPATLRDSLEIAGFTEDQADYAMDNCVANWDEEAAESGYLYAIQVIASRKEVHDFLINVGFDENQATYGVYNCGIDWYEQAVTVANKYVYTYAPCALYGVKMQFLDGDWENAEIEYAIANVDADFNEMALERARQLIADMSISEAYVRYALMNEMYMESESDYAIANLDCNWELEAVGAAWDWLDQFPDSTHDELHNLLTINSWFTDAEADYACSYVGK